jgi:FADH2 O2-dependent halogenase
MRAVAVRNGAVYKQRTDVTDVRFHDAGVELVCADGKQFTAKFVADAGGYRSLLATKLSLRPKPLAALTHSRALFTHMVGIKHYHTFGHSLAEHGLPSPLHQGTLHHIFEGGWFWIIPFNNHPESTNPLCSIGLNLDPRRYPKTNKSPDAELNEFLVRFPSIAPHFKGAQLVRDWVNTDPLQYSATQVVGDRWCLMGHAAGAVDALFSRGLFHTTATVHIVADRLLRALSDGQFKRERFKRIEEVVLTGLAYNDRTVACSYAAFSNFELWNAWYRVYGLGAFLESLKLARAHLKYVETGDATYLEVLEGTPFRSLGGGLDSWAALFDGAASLVEAAEKGTTGPSNAARGIYELLGKQDYVPPALDITSPSRRYLSDVSMPGLMKLIAWGKLKAPRYVRDLFFDIDTSVVLSEQMKWLPITLKLQQNPVVRHLAGRANGQQ